VYNFYNKLTVYSDLLEITCFDGALHHIHIVIVKPGTHWWQSRLLPKLATKLTVVDKVKFVADIVDFVAVFRDKSATT